MIVSVRSGIEKAVPDRFWRQGLQQLYYIMNAVINGSFMIKYI